MKKYQTYSFDELVKLLIDELKKTVEIQEMHLPHNSKDTVYSITKIDNKPLNKYITEKARELIFILLQYTNIPYDEKEGNMSIGISTEKSIEISIMFYSNDTHKIKKILLLKNKENKIIFIDNEDSDLEINKENELYLKLKYNFSEF